jgi:phospholipase/carboxylesterase
MVFVETPTLLATLVRTPEGFDPDRSYPLFIALHGFGHSAEGFLGMGAPFYSAGIIFASVRAPYPFLLEDGQLGYDWSLQHLGRLGVGDRAAELTVEYILTLVAGLRARYAVDRVYLMGFSQGGAFAYMSAIPNHTEFDGLVVFGARFDESWFADEGLSEGRDLAVFISHGESDQAISIAASERARDTLTALGYDVTFRPFEGGHTVPQEVMAEVIRWIAER